MVTHSFLKSGSSVIVHNTDLADRDKVLDKLRDFFGFRNVVPISNYNRFALKSLVKDLSKFHGVPFDEVNAATRTVEQDVRRATTKHGDDKNLFVLKYDDALKYSQSFSKFIEKNPKIEKSIEVLFKQNRSLGRHAGGVLICDDLPNKMPLITSKGEPQAPWQEGVNVKHLEKVGEFIKYDLLGLKTLRLIERTIELILKKEGIKKPNFIQIKTWFTEHMGLGNIDLNDQKVYEYVYHAGRWAGIFQCTGRGAQKFFVKAKPKNIMDIAALTSIYRPGPLAADVDKLWLQHEEEPYDWGHPLINETLKETRGLLVFQESVMALANKVAGFPLDETDQVRRAIMKRSVSGGAAARKKASELENTFINGAVDKGVPIGIAKKAYQNILWMAGYGFNRSHAVAYAIDSYYCAWLLTHYEEEWLSAYLESMSGSDADRAKAFSEVRAFGYQIVPIDIRDAAKSWKVLPGKRLMPSMLACKGVGEAAIDELESFRPFDNIEELLWDSDGHWRLSKFNKKALEAMIKAGAFASLGVIGEDGYFNNYNHMYKVVIENINEIKKSPRKDPAYGKRRFFELIKELEDTPPWTRTERIENIVSHLGSVDVNALLPKEVLARLDEKDIRSIDDYCGRNVYWFCISKAIPKKSKNGKKYMLLELVSLSGKIHKTFMWGWDGMIQFEKYELCVAELSRNEFGFATSQRKIRRIDV